jgi:hypothetical protein
MSEISSLRKRVDGWELNSGKARVSVPLRELRSALAHIEAIEAAGRPLSNAAFNISRMSPPQIDTSHLVSLRAAQEAWDAAIAPANTGEKP